MLWVALSCFELLLSRFNSLWFVLFCLLSNISSFRFNSLRSDEMFWFRKPQIWLNSNNRQWTRQPTQTGYIDWWICIAQTIPVHWNCSLQTEQTWAFFDKCEYFALVFALHLFLLWMFRIYCCCKCFSFIMNTLR